MSLFAERLKTAMQRAQMTSAQLAKATGIGRSSISQWLSSKYVAKQDKVTALAQALSVTPEWLLGTVTVASGPKQMTPELVTLWEQLDATNQKKLLKKARKLVLKQAPTAKTSKPKGKKKKAKK
ncbi:transcriptional regulator [Lactobacillus sp. CBA3605]|uniref:helix-turn-helix domain-containing protein n=1 Tax=Lactobacillus sp. CBA3605 TaxID=2099788 RepID=UPI000CFB0836|nr:helix-turn-helix domain-containing protein [Lactobacillus sp. CBA3605]AVK61505.1 transcriptional regulator [Lactobacillus sp. CBA3605]